jgi:predicted transcriptional regulator
MEEDTFEDEFSMIYEKPVRRKVLDSETFKSPIKNLKLRRPTTLDADRSVQEAVALMRSKKVGCILVTSSGSKLAGILTERDILTKITNLGGDLQAMKIREIMTAEPGTLEPEDSIAFVMNSMHVGGYRHVPIVDEANVPLAVVSVKDVIGFIVENFSEEILNLPPHPLRKPLHEDGG